MCVCLGGGGEWQHVFRRIAGLSLNLTKLLNTDSWLHYKMSQGILSTVVDLGVIIEETYFSD